MLTRKTLSLADAKQHRGCRLGQGRRRRLDRRHCRARLGGHLIYLERADGTQLGSVVVAQEKSRTALLFKRPTKVLEDSDAGWPRAHDVVAGHHFPSKAVCR